MNRKRACALEESLAFMQLEQLEWLPQDLECAALPSGKGKGSSYFVHAASMADWTVGNGEFMSEADQPLSSICNSQDATLLWWGCHSC